MVADDGLGIAAAGRMETALTAGNQDVSDHTIGAHRRDQKPRAQLPLRGPGKITGGQRGEHRHSDPESQAHSDLSSRAAKTGPRAR